MGSSTVKIGPSTVARMVSGEIIWDSELRRFGVRRRNATTTYFVKARVDGRQRWIKLGRHGPLTPAEARSRARQVLGEIDCGHDPTRSRDVGKVTPLFSEFANRWLALHVHVKRKPATAAEYERIVALHLTPALGKVRVDRIERADVLAIQERLSTTPYQANRAVAVLSAMMTFAEALKHRPQMSNPCLRVERFKESKRKRPLTLRELSLLWRHLTEMERTENPYVVGALKLLLLSGMRKEEVLTLKRSFIDRDLGGLRLPDTKTGPRTIILSERAMHVILAMPQLDGNPYVFAGIREGQRLVNIQDHWDTIRRALGFPEVRIHDLRHTVGSLMARSAPLIVVRDALGHRELATTNGYSHAANNDIRVAVNSYAELLVGL